MPLCHNYRKYSDLFQEYYVILILFSSHSDSHLVNKEFSDYIPFLLVLRQWRIKNPHMTYNYTICYVYIRMLYYSLIVEYILCYVAEVYIKSHLT